MSVFKQTHLRGVVRENRIRSVVRELLGGAAPAFALTDLFASGEVGLITEPWTLSTLYQDAGITPVTADGDPIGQAQDTSGGDYHLSQATSAARPTYTLDGSSLPYIGYDGIDDVLTRDDAFLPSGNAARAFAIACHFAGVDQYLFDYGTVTDSQRFFVHLLSTGAIRVNIGIKKAETAAGVLTSGANHVITVELPAGGVLGDVEVRVNGGAALALTGDTAVAVNTTLNGSLALGSLTNGFYSVNRIYGFVARDAVFSTEERSNTVSLLAGKCGVTL